MKKKIIFCIILIMIAKVISTMAAAEGVGDSGTEIPEDGSITYVDLDYSETYDGLYEDFFGDYEFINCDEMDEELAFDLKNAYIKLCEFDDNDIDEISFEDFVSCYYRSGTECISEYLESSLPKSTGIQSRSSSDGWYYNTGTSLPGEASYDLYNLLSIVRKGDLIYEDAGTSAATLVGHIAIVEGVFWDTTEERFYVRLVEAVSDGVCRGVLDDTRFKQKGVHVIRVKSASYAQKHGAVDFFIGQLGKPYSLAHLPQTSKDSDSWYCSELAWAAYKSVGILLTDTTGPVITPYSIYCSQDTVLIKVSTSKPSTLFTDINISWARNGIEYLANNGILFGITNTKFSPYTTLNRAMVVTVLYRLEGCPSSLSVSKFSDVRNPNVYYYDAVNWAGAKGIVTGYDDGEFKPSLAVTREQLVTFMYRYAKYKGFDTRYSSGALSQFSDRDSISTYAQIPMKWAVTQGIINGLSTTSIAPRYNSNRAQAATIFYRFICELM